MKNGHSKMVQEREKMKKKEKSELSPRAARELKRVLVNFEFTMDCYESVYSYAKAEPEDRGTVILAMSGELKNVENYFSFLNELAEITPEDRIQMIKILRRKFYELVKSYV